MNPAAALTVEEGALEGLGYAGLSPSRTCPLKLLAKWVGMDKRSRKNSARYNGLKAVWRFRFFNPLLRDCNSYYT